MTGEKPDMTLHSKVTSGLAWKFAERCLAQLVSFVVSIVLARLLTPEDYGLVAMVLVFTAIANVFVANGFSSALIQRKDASQVDFSSMFWCSLAIAVLLFALMFLCAPLIASFYERNELVDITRVYSIILLIAPFSTIQSAYVSRHMMFRKFFFSTLSGTILSGVLGIALALAGFGVWALVWQSISRSAFNTITLFAITPWRPHLLFELKAAKRLLDYGWKVLCADLIGTIFNNIRQLLIGKFYSSADLGFYNQGQKFPDLICNNIEASLSAVLFPAMSNYDDDPQAVKRMMRRAIQVLSFLITPLMVLLACVAEPLVEVLLTEKWLPCVPFLQILAINRIVDLISGQNVIAMKAMGRSGTVLKIEFIKKPIALVIILISATMSIEALVWSTLLCSVVYAAVNIFPNRKLINYGYLEQIKDMIPSILLSCVMAAALILFSLVSIPALAKLILEICLGIVVYVGLSYLFHMESLFYVARELRSFLSRGR